eukprot:CAMPEP_0119498630 /NCGR_PEP_ID=MMETSP1344-20130328/21332_1 /TAXON_ID=236787 /ORGANISM="Florenciella parvula, Strain CCMP2471" /LENGTH=248 /DNA_ID=CAMNT_0007534537 /DNA_START=149 /DNA_END=895 /DNA_ORIENTATION=+
MAASDANPDPTTTTTTTMSPSSMWCFNESPMFGGGGGTSQASASQPVSPNVLQAVEEIRQGEMDQVFVRGFGRTTLDGAAGYALAGALLQSATGGMPGLGRLGLVGCRMTNAGAWALASGIRFDRELRVLEISSCSISDMGVATVMTALSHTNVESIIMTKCGITDETARMIAERLKEPNSYHQLQLICLDDNVISDKSLPHLAEAMRVNRSNGGKLNSVGLRGAGGVDEEHVVNEHSDIWLGGLLMD